MKYKSMNAARRDFLKTAGFTSLSFMLPGLSISGNPEPAYPFTGPDRFSQINFVYDGLNYTPEEYLDVLMQLNQHSPIEPDFYGQGGATGELERQFAQITGKEKAVFLPTGTMANEVVIKLLAGDRTKIVVPENSHIYRDEADASATVHRKRLIPAGMGKPYFDVDDLDRIITYYKQGEVFRSDVGAVSIESPVRRADNAVVPIAVIRDISAYCKEQGYGLHLDGARLHLASAWTGISIKEYASYFDTVYISQYKLLNAAYGAILCGDGELIDRIPHQNKILGGMMLHNWMATAMSLFHLRTIDEDLKKTREAAQKLISLLNGLDELIFTPVEFGTNIYNLQMAGTIDQQKLADTLMNDHNIWIRVPGNGDVIKLKVNPSIFRRPVEDVYAAWENSLRIAGQ
jgi:threonine aldolase